jgi:hypothetical protein
MPNKLDPEFYAKISAFYLALWDHLDALSERSRWLRAHQTSSSQDRTAEISRRFEELQKSLPVDPVLMSSLTDHYKRTLGLAHTFLGPREADDAALLHQVEECKTTLQSLALEFARLESVT